MRKPDALVRVLLHQNGKNHRPEQETIERAAKIRAHYQIWPSGKITKIYDPLARLRVSSNRANATCVAIEFSGNFEGIPGRGVWRPKTCKHCQAGKCFAHDQATLTEAQIVSGQVLIAELIALFPTIREINAHRQWAKDRPICPGWQIWKLVAEPCILTHGLKDTSDQAYDGSTIHETWRAR